MKDALKKLIASTILFEYKLPNTNLGIEKTCVTHLNLSDDCYKSLDSNNLNRIIYESILYYSYDDFQLLGGDHQKMFINAFNSKFKYNYSANELAKRKLGIYGEALLNAILKHFYKTDTLVSRGYFYDIQKKSEVTGYDSFHLIQEKGNLELWFGETKFYEDYEGAVDSIFKNINKAISDDYLVKTNFVTILQRKGSITDQDSKIYKILDKWEKGIIDSLEKELKDNNIKLVYPVLITFDIQNSNFDETIKLVVKYIKDKHCPTSFKNISIEYSIFFILMPIENVKDSKLAIIKWIDKNEPLML